MAKSEKNSKTLSVEQLDQKLKWNIHEIAKFDPNRKADAEIKETLALSESVKRERLDQLRQELQNIRNNLLVPIAPNQFISLKELNEKLSWNIREYGRLNSDYNFEEELKSMQNMRPYKKAARLVELRRLRESQYAPPPPRVHQNLHNQILKQMNRCHTI